MEKSLLDYEQKRFNNFTNSFEMDDETRKKCTKKLKSEQKLFFFNINLSARV